MASRKKHIANEPEIVNRKARHDYTIEETLEVGIRLAGTEVKAVRAGRISLNEAYVRAESTPPSLTLHAAHIGEYAPAGANQHPAVRQRELLAHKREIADLARLSAVKGVTIVPLKLYFKNGYAKLLIGVGRGKGRSDKREDLKKREAQRDIDRAMSHRA
ncbi:MAG: SsrA-binding protein SmpB [Phycisphaeraceae bacterium]|nr:SsrA-binding protein SmpB [Phycisphaeraceae bacterium]MCB9848020.1 SsrA-binding protein SmpB [Phycisphaeraceae bacterium]